jgi:hypothetical protein
LVIKLLDLELDPDLQLAKNTGSGSASTKLLLIRSPVLLKNKLVFFYLVLNSTLGQTVQFCLKQFHLGHTTFLDFLTSYLTDRTVKISLRKGQKNLKMENVESWALSYRKHNLTFFSVGLCWKQNSLWSTENWFPQISV